MELGGGGGLREMVGLFHQLSITIVLKVSVAIIHPIVVLICMLCDTTMTASV